MSLGFSHRPALLALAAALAFMGVAVLIHAPMAEAAFRSDRSPVSWLSSAQLWALAFVCIQLGTQRLLPPRLALWLAFAMLLMAADEQFMWHEQWKYGCPLGWCVPEPLREAPIQLVALLGALSTACLHRALPPPARFWLWCGLGMGLLAIVVDQFGWPRALMPWEEGLEVLAEALFGGALLGLRRS